MNPHFQLPSSVTSFHAYFELKAETEDILAALGYTFEAALLELPQVDQTPAWVAVLQEQTLRGLSLVTLSSETARREILIGPVLLQVALQLHAKLRIEYAIEAADNLRGSLDYLLQAQERLLVIEAKQADLTRGFNQLAAELIALDRWSDSSESVLYGAVSIGESWRFARLDRSRKHVVQDLRLFAFPDEFESLARTLLGILSGVGR
jgi:hypothetical protein